MFLSENETTFNVSVNGVNGVIEIPSGFYVGSTLAEALQTRINQIEDPLSGQQTGGVTVKYNPSSNNFTFTTGTTGPESTIKVKGITRLGLDDVPLGVGSVPQIYNLKQATDMAGNDLFVDASALSLCAKLYICQSDFSQKVAVAVTSKRH